MGGRFYLFEWIKLMDHIFGLNIMFMRKMAQNGKIRQKYPIFGFLTDCLSDFDII